MVPFEIPHKISYPYIDIEGCDFYTTPKFEELLGLRAATASEQSTLFHFSSSFRKRQAHWKLYI